jgi:hypothetical protein
MLSWFKPNPLKKLDKQYQAKLKEAMEYQRNGNIRRYSEVTQEAENIRLSLELLKNKNSHN